MKAGCCADCPVMSNWSEGCQLFEQVGTESCGSLCALNEDLRVYHPPALHHFISLFFELSGFLYSDFSTTGNAATHMMDAQVDVG